MNPRKFTRSAASPLSAVLFCLSFITAQAAPTFPEPAGSDTAGFVSIFDGKSLSGWDADPTYWRVEGGILGGEVTPETLLKANSFAIWRGGTPADFELKVEYRVSAAGNSGINYRSSEVPEPAFALKGYQCDIDGTFRWTGQMASCRSQDGFPRRRRCLGGLLQIFRGDRLEAVPHFLRRTDG